MPRHGLPLRLFVAIYPPADSARSLLTLLDTLTLPNYRATPVDQLHLTAHFIGDTPQRDLRDTLESVERSCAGLDAFALTPHELITIPLPPDRSPPRLVAATTDAPPTLLELHRRLVTRLSRVRERRGHFHPHFTLCRFPQGVYAERINTPVAAVAPGVQGALAPFTINEVLVMSSRLTAAGAVHERVAGIGLG